MTNFIKTVIHDIEKYGDIKKDWLMAFAMGLQVFTFGLNLFHGNFYLVVFNACFFLLLFFQYLMMLAMRQSHEFIDELFDLLHSQQEAYGGVIDTMAREVERFKAGFAAKGTNGKSTKTKTKR
jgi:hypothetical protein